MRIGAALARGLRCSSRSWFGRRRSGASFFRAFDPRAPPDVEAAGASDRPPGLGSFRRPPVVTSALLALGGVISVLGICNPQSAKPVEPAAIARAAASEATASPGLPSVHARR
jgi:hypothetical protein